VARNKKPLHYPDKVVQSSETTLPEARDKRLQTCAGCEYHTGLRCRVCGCFTGAKAALAHEECPVGKWPA
jgi:hypothetical protein